MLITEKVQQDNICRERQGLYDGESMCKHHGDRIQIGFFQVVVLS